MSLGQSSGHACGGGARIVRLILQCANTSNSVQLTQKEKSWVASATVVQTISNKFTAVVSNVVQWLDESYPVEHYGRHLEFHSFLVCGEAAPTKREKLDSFSDSGSNYFPARL